MAVDDGKIGVNFRESREERRGVVEKLQVNLSR